MRTLIFSGLLLVLAIMPAMTQDHKVVKTLGDLNGDGVKEVAVEKWGSGSSGSSPVVTIMSGQHEVLKFGLSGSTADGYKIIGSQIVVWQGDWDRNEDKYKPFYYNLAWYGWDKKTKKYIVVKMAYTIQTYDLERAKKIIPQMATKTVDQGLIVTLPVQPSASSMPYIRQTFHFSQNYPREYGTQIFLSDQQMTFVRPEVSDAGITKLVPSPDKKLWAVEFRDALSKPDTGTVGIFNPETRHFYFIAGWRLNSPGDVWSRGASNTTWLGKKQLRVTIRATSHGISKTYRQIFDLGRIKEFCSPEQKIAEVIDGLFKTDKDFKGMTLVWTAKCPGTSPEEIHALLLPKSEKFPGWYLQFNLVGKLLSKEEISGE